MGLLDGLVGHWQLEEPATQTRPESQGITALDLVDTQVVGNRAGKIGNSPNFQAVSQDFLNTAANPPGLSFGDVPMAAACWVSLRAAAPSGGIASKYQSTGNLREYTLFYRGGATDRFRFAVTPDGSTFTTVQADSFGSPTPKDNVTFWFIVVQHDPIANVISIQVNNGPVDTAAHTTGIFAGTQRLDVGVQRDATNAYYDGSVDELSIHSRNLTSADVTEMYNGGAGLPFSQWTSDVPAGQIEASYNFYWQARTRRA